jgi:hypothetical protein
VDRKELVMVESLRSQLVLLRARQAKAQLRVEEQALRLEEFASKGFDTKPVENLLTTYTGIVRLFTEQAERIADCVTNFQPLDFADASTVTAPPTDRHRRH